MATAGEPGVADCPQGEVVLVTKRSLTLVAPRNLSCCNATSLEQAVYENLSAPATMTTRDRPWLIRTYAGHSTAAKSNELYRTNLGRGQTGLSVAYRS
jgi:methylmalonyl-CoA mutase N-terminal domain/subunit